MILTYSIVCAFASFVGHDNGGLLSLKTYLEAAKKGQLLLRKTKSVT